jgi:formate hydrogenlyase transcriptional activator
MDLQGDLFYRLNVFPIKGPATEGAGRDISNLREILRRKAQGLTPVPSISDAQMGAEGMGLAGSIRVQNVIERAVIVSTGPNLEVPLQDLQPNARKAAAVSKPATFHDTERDAILGALRESGGVIAGPSGAAARLGLRRTTLQSKMRRLGIRRPSF